MVQRGRAALGTLGIFAKMMSENKLLMDELEQQRGLPVLIISLSHQNGELNYFLFSASNVSVIAVRLN